MEGDCFVLVSRASAGHLLESPLKHYANASNKEHIKNKNSSVKSIRFFFDVQTNGLFVIHVVGSFNQQPWLLCQTELN